ncbi:hypothetical protein [Burkholderia ambifaria]|nr:hypothetical protein [Burkholderia ambifaria]
MIPILGCPGSNAVGIALMTIVFSSKGLAGRFERIRITPAA